MPKYNEPIVELTKIINQAPFDTIWVYWEHDILYDIVGVTSSQIKVRTHDKVLSGSSASIGFGNTFSRIPVGTYSIGTYSNPYPHPGFDDYKLVVATAGWISHVLNGTSSMSTSQEKLIPNVSETYFELVAETNQLVPFFKESAPGDYRIGASYSHLSHRENFTTIITQTVSQTTVDSIDSRSPSILGLTYSVTTTSIMISGSLDEEGTLYYYMTDKNIIPNRTTVKNQGQNMSTSSMFVINYTTLIPGRTYYVYLMTVDEVKNYSELISLTITTSES